MKQSGFRAQIIFLSTGLGPRVFGKRPEGRIPVWSKIIHLPYLIYCEYVWRLTCLLSRENPTDIVSDNLIVGRRLRACDLPSGVSNYRE